MRSAAKLTLVLVALATAGCGEDMTGAAPGPDAQGPAEMTYGLDDAYWTGDTADESPGFGDPYFFDALNADIPVADALADSGDVDEPAGADVFLLRVVWGRLAELPEPVDDGRPECGALVWDGGLAVSDGALRPVAVIRFERTGEYADALVLPREDRQVLEWTSVTGCGIDGVLVRVVVPRAGDDSDGLTPDDTITFTSAALGAPVTFPLEGLAGLEETVRVDDENGLVFTGLDRDDAAGPCRRGVMEGAWVAVPGDAHAGGYFRAAWLGADGTLFGHVRGRWGFRGGNGVFVGKLIGADGAYRGHVRGVVERSAAGEGVFRGRWVVAGRAGETIQGGVHGRWGVRAAGEGSLRGVWTTRCNPRHDERDSDAGERDPS